MTIFDRPNECRFDCASPWIVNPFEQSAFGIINIRQSSDRQSALRKASRGEAL
jgi:hypothetical protein